ncbi:MAG: NAD(P)-dependent oxidoreductase [Sulfuritalea sp.]|jgi:nucleoside-diphosphate-sugar epimerase|nr:NAD(P)-dependent oxidoreductase [Sulfuritalea sp.]
MACDPGQRRALVTGATGYIGSHLVKFLVDSGWQTSIVIRPGSDLGCLDELQNRIEILVHDGTVAGMVKLVASSRPDTVFHLASLFLAQHRSEDIDTLVTSNVLFATQLVEAMATAGCGRLINVGTSWQHYANDGYNPVNLYAATKQAFDDILRYYVEATPIKAVTLTLFDSYGPNDPRRKLLSLLRDAAMHGTRLQMSPGDQLIDLVYIDDMIAAFLCAASLLPVPDRAHMRYRVSSGEPVNLRQLVATIERVTGKTLAIDWGGRPYRPREVMLPFCPHPPLPGWAPSISLDQGIARVMFGAS